MTLLFYLGCLFWAFVLCWFLLKRRILPKSNKVALENTYREQRQQEMLHLLYFHELFHVRCNIPGGRKTTTTQTKAINLNRIPHMGWNKSTVRREPWSKNGMR